MVTEGMLSLPTKQEESDGLEAKVSTRKQERMAGRPATFVGRLTKHLGTCGQLATTALLIGAVVEGRA